MKNLKIGFERILFERIQETWKSEQVRSNSLAKKNPPELEAIRAVVETAFFASLKKEEGRPIEFALVLMTEAEIVSTKFWKEYGPIRGFAKHDDETILCWKDCRVSMSL